MDLRQALIKGTIWTAVGRYSTYGVQLFIAAILARLLDPADFGLLGMVMVYTGFVNVLADAGIGSAVVQKRDLNDADLSSVFWLSGAVSLVLFAVTLLTAPALEWFFEFPGLTPATRVMGLNFLFVGLAAVPEGRLRRNLSFNRIAGVEILSAVLSGVIAVGLAFLGAGHWALVAQVTCNMAIRFIAVLVLGGWRPRLVFEWSVVKKVVGFSGYVLGFNSINYWARSADNLLVGKFLGAASLGFYMQAYRLMMLPYQLIIGVMTTPLHSVFATIQDDASRTRNAYLKVLKFIVCISFPLAAFMFVMAPQLIRVVWGTKWEPSIPVFEYLALVAGLQPAAASTGSVLLSRNKANLFFILGIFTTVIYVVGFVIAVPFGIVTMAKAYLIANLIVTPFVLVVTYKVALDGQPSDLLKPFGVAFSSFIGLLLMLFFLSHYWGSTAEIFQLIVSGALSGALVLILLLGKTQRKHWTINK